MLEFKVKSEKMPDRRWFSNGVKSFESLFSYYVKNVDPNMEVISFEEIKELPEGSEDFGNVWILDIPTELNLAETTLSDPDRMEKVTKRLSAFAKKLVESIPTVTTSKEIEVGNYHYSISQKDYVELSRQKEIVTKTEYDYSKITKEEVEKTLSLVRKIKDKVNELVDTFAE